MNGDVSFVEMEKPGGTTLTGIRSVSEGGGLVVGIKGTINGEFFSSNLGVNILGNQGAEP